MNNCIPRRHRIDQYTPAEQAISQAIDVVERAGAHIFLTEAVTLLGQAKDKVADFADLNLQMEAGQRLAHIDAIEKLANHHFEEARHVFANLGRQEPLAEVLRKVSTTIQRWEIARELFDVVDKMRNEGHYNTPDCGG